MRIMLNVLVSEWRPYLLIASVQDRKIEHEFFSVTLRCWKEQPWFRFIFPYCAIGRVCVLYSILNLYSMRMMLSCPKNPQDKKNDAGDSSGNDDDGDQDELEYLKGIPALHFRFFFSPPLLLCLHQNNLYSIMLQNGPHTTRHVRRHAFRLSFYFWCSKEIVIITSVKTAVLMKCSLSQLIIFYVMWLCSWRWWCDSE